MLASVSCFDAYPVCPELAAAAYEWLLVGRALLPAYDLLINVNQELQSVAPKYVKASRHRLRHYLDTGRYVARVGIEEMR